METTDNRIDQLKSLNIESANTFLEENANSYGITNTLLHPQKFIYDGIFYALRNYHGYLLLATEWDFKFIVHSSSKLKFINT